MTTPNYASKSTPNKSGAISKSLLTPCRRVGLGRKAAGKSPLTPSPLGKQGVLGQRETPVQKRRVADGDKTTSESFKKLKANDQESMNESYETDSCKIKKTSKAVSEKQTGGGGQKPKQSAIDEKQETDSCRKQKANNRKQNTDCVKKGDSCSGSKANKKQKSTNCKDQVSPLPLQNHNKSCMNVTNQSTDPSEAKVKKAASFTKRLSMKKSQSFADSDYSDDDDLPLVPKNTSLSQNLRYCTVEDGQIMTDKEASKTKVILNSSDLECKNLEQATMEKQPNSRMSKRRLVLDSSDEEVSKSVTTENEPKRTLILGSCNAAGDLEQLCRLVKEKEDRLAKLKQAEVYRRVHNIEELEQLTGRWKKGCQDALRQLVVRLQEHGLISSLDMLMRKFSIGPDVFTYDPQTDRFT